MTHVDLRGLRIGAATAAVQIEGGDTGNQWHSFAQRPGRIKDGSTPTPATDHWTRWREDTALLAELQQAYLDTEGDLEGGETPSQRVGP